MCISGENEESKSVPDDYKPNEGDKLTDDRINSSSTVHPNVLLRTPVFTPTTRAKTRSGRSVNLGKMEELLVGEMEGYTNIKIHGLRLSVETDFRIWCGLVRVIQESGYRATGDISLPFSAFARICGYDVKRIDNVLRDRIKTSMTRIMTQVVEFSNKDGSSTTLVNLVTKAVLDQKNDLIVITPCPSLWRLYKMDYTTFIKQKVINALPRSELAVCLYMYIQSMPANPGLRSMTRLRERMRLTGEIKSQNRSIMNGLEKLREIGYLKYHIKVNKRDSFLKIDARDPKLKLNDVKNKLKTDDEDDDNPIS